jgi:hypothetical protein
MAKKNGKENRVTNKNGLSDRKSNIDKAIKSFGNKSQIVISLILFIVVWSLLTFYEHDLLLKVESHSLFLFDSTFLFDNLRSVGGLLTYLSTFLTQFLYIPWLGALIYTLLLNLAAYFTFVAYDIPKKWSIVSFFPAILLLAGNMHLGYTLFIIKGLGFFFSPLIGYIVTIGITIAFKKVSNNYISCLSILLFGIIGYPLFGFWALLGLISIASGILFDGNKAGKWGIFIIAVLSASTVPLIASQLYMDMRASDIYTIDLQQLPYNDEFISYYIPYIIIGLFVIFIPIFSKKILSEKTELNYKKYAISQIIIIGIYILTVWGFWFKESNFRAEIKMSVAVDKMDWKRVIEIHQKTTSSKNFSATEPTRLMVQYKNLALAKMGNEGNLIYSYRDGGKMQKSPQIITMMIQCGKQLYLHYGLLNYCYRWCIEDAVEYGWNVSDLKYAVMSSLLSNDHGVTKKYLNLLDKTLFHRKWALAQRELMQHSESIAESKEYKSIIPLICKDNTIDNDNVMIEMYLMNYFTKKRPTYATPEFDRISLMWAMQTQDIPTFWSCFSNYTTTNVIKRMPRYYQEAALLYGNLEKNVDISSMPFDKEVISSFNNFNNFASKNPVRDLDESRPLYYNKFGKTFYYFYYFIRGLKSF